MKNLDPTKKANSTLTNGNDSNDEDDTLEEESDEETATAMISRMSTQKKRQTKSRGNSNLNEDFVFILEKQPFVVKKSLKFLFFN